MAARLAHNQEVEVRILAPPPISWFFGAVAQLVRALPCRGRSRGFKSRQSRQLIANLASPVSGDFLVCDITQV